MGFYIYLHILVYNEGISVITFFIITFINLTLRVSEKNERNR